MEAPTKAGGTRGQRGSRDLIGRLSTFPPIKFLKRYSRSWRRRSPQIGFDQPPKEMKQLALPLRPAPPSIWTKLQSLGTRMLARAAFVVGRASGKASHAWRRAMVPVRAAGARIVVMLQPAVRVVGAVGQRVTVRAQAVSARMDAILQPAPWEATQTGLLLSRTQRVRRTLVGLVACEWTATAGLLALLSIHAVQGHWSTPTVNVCGLIVSMLGLVGMVLYTWHENLLAAWKGMELFICDRCGELRNFSPSLPCPNCGTESIPVLPGQVPDGWGRRCWSTSALGIAGPAIVGGMLLIGGHVLG